MKAITILPGLRLIEEKGYAPGSADNPRLYKREFRTDPANTHFTTAYGIGKMEEGSETYPLIILGSGGASTLTDHSIVLHGDWVYVAIDDSVVAIDMNGLNIIWCTKVDAATCFGIYLSTKDSSLISWGELDIAKVNLNGNVKWSVSGNDIFTSGFEIKNEHVYVMDFEGQRYKIDLKYGKIARVKP